MIATRTLIRRFFLALGDIFIVIFSINLAFIVRLKRPLNFFEINPRNLSVFLILISYLFCFYIFNLYDTKREFKGLGLIRDVFLSLILVSLFITIIFYAFPYKFGRGIYLISIVLIGIIVIIWRLIYSLIFKVAISPFNLVIIGVGEAAHAIFSILQKNPDYKLVGFIDDNPIKKEYSETSCLGNIRSLETIVNNYKIEYIVVTVDPSKDKQLNESLLKCKMKGINIHDIPSFYENIANKLPLSHIKEKWFLYCDGFDKLSNKVHKRLKRVTDILISIFILLISFPLILVFSIAIKLNSRGPVFFTQERVGQNMNKFMLIKFRTMILGAEKKEPVWAEINDPRTTWIGKILRKSRLDELPQLINVIKGEMSLVGPRPEREFFVKKLLKKIPFYSLRFSVKPGLTGWAQINYRYGSSEKDALEKLQYELYYVKNMSLFLDLKILLKTIRVVTLGMGR